MTSTAPAVRVRPPATRSMIGMNWMNRAPQLVAEEAVDLAAAVAVRGVHRGQRRSTSTPARAQVLEPAHHLVEGALAALVHAVGVVQLARPVDRDPDEEVVLLEERAHSSSSSVPFVWIVYDDRWPGRR